MYQRSNVCYAKEVRIIYNTYYRIRVYELEIKISQLKNYYYMYTPRKGLKQAAMQRVKPDPIGLRQIKKNSLHYFIITCIKCIDLNL